MRALNENERDEIEAVKHYIKYVITSPNIEGFKIWDACLKFQEVAEKYVLTDIVTEQELSELLDIDDFKELMEKLMGLIYAHLDAKEAK